MKPTKISCQSFTQLNNITGGEYLALSRLSSVVLLSVWKFYQLDLFDSLWKQYWIVKQSITIEIMSDVICFPMDKWETLTSVVYVDKKNDKKKS